MLLLAVLYRCEIPKTIRVKWSNQIIDDIKSPVAYSLYLFGIMSSYGFVLFFGT